MTHLSMHFAEALQQGRSPSNGKFQYWESTVHTLVVATSDKPRTSFQVVRNYLCSHGMHKISEPVYCGKFDHSKITNFGVFQKINEKHIHKTTYYTVSKS